MKKAIIVNILAINSQIAIMGKQQMRHAVHVVEDYLKLLP